MLFSSHVWLLWSSISLCRCRLHSYYGRLWLIVHNSLLFIHHINVGLLLYSLPSAGPGADPSAQAVRPQVTIWVIYPGSRLPLLSARPAVTFPAKERHRPSTSTKLYCSMTDALGANNLTKVVTQLCSGANGTDDLLIASPTPYRITPLRYPTSDISDMSRLRKTFTYLLIYMHINANFK